MRQKSQGFSLTELILVIVVMAILSLVAFMSWPGPTFNILAEANKIASDIRYTQSLSMSLNEKYRLYFSAINSYKILDGTGNNIHTFTKAKTILSLPKGITIQINTTSKYLLFNRRGVPYLATSKTSDGNKMTNNFVITLSKSGTSHTITVIKNTGYVKVQ